MEPRVSNGSLYFSYPNHYNIKNDHVKLKIYTSNLDGVCQSGATKVKIGEVFHFDVLSVYQSGNSYHEMADGTVNRLVADGSGNSKIFAKSFSTKNVELSGNSFAEVAASDLLKVPASGRVRIKYGVTPAATDLHSSGVAGVERQ